MQLVMYAMPHLLNSVLTQQPALQQQSRRCSQPPLQRHGQRLLYCCRHSPPQQSAWPAAMRPAPQRHRRIPLRKHRGVCRKGLCELDARLLDLCKRRNKQRQLTGPAGAQHQAGTATAAARSTYPTPRCWRR